MDNLWNNLTYNKDTRMWNFERNFDTFAARKWINNNWEWPVGAAVAYVLAVFLGQKLMHSKERFTLRTTLISWNMLLAIFSIIGAMRTVPRVVEICARKGIFSSWDGFTDTMCDATYWREDNVIGFWFFVFALSKIAELGDTAFIVLRKQKLIFLHWYHHITVLLYTWLTLSDWSSHVSTGIVNNLVVHSFMYTYYFTRAMGYKVHKYAAMFITTIQLLQMVWGTVINVLTIHIKSNSKPSCEASYTNLWSSLFIYFTYFLLFGNFFYRTYISPVHDGKSSSTVKHHQNGVQKKIKKTV